MGIENLQNAARAAGFAMVDAEEPLTEAKRDVGETWLPKAALLQQEPKRESPIEKAQVSLGEWVKGVFGTTGRAPA